MKKFIVFVCAALIFAGFTVSAQNYTSDLPSYCPVSGGSWAEVQTAQGKAVIVFPITYQKDYFSFSGSTGYNLVNVSNGTVSGNIYYQNATSYYENPTQLQCRFQSFGNLQVYEPYRSGTNIAHRWTDISVSNVLNTNIAFMDDRSDRQNNDFLYSTDQKILILIFIVSSSVILYYVFRSMWRSI